MSRIANQPINIPAGVEVNIANNIVLIKGKIGEMSFSYHEDINIVYENDCIKISTDDTSKFVKAMTGTSRALLQNIVTGVTEGFERKLDIVGVGYRAATDNKKLNLTLGFSHPVVFDIPDGISIETPSQTEIVIKGSDKQKVGQVAANIRAYRPPEPYKGKGVKYSDERIIRKEAKKA
jgi:large subunit ribosomal protein L6